MYQGRPDPLSAAVDDVWSKPSNGEHGIAALFGTLLLFTGLRRRSLPLICGGGALIYRGVSGKSPLGRVFNGAPAVSTRNVLEIEESVTVNRPADEIYNLWRRLENLPRFMSHIESVNVDAGNRSHWVARLPAPLRLAWDAEISDDQPGKKLAWRSLPGTSVQHQGSVLFHSTPRCESTEVKIILHYRPPAGGAGAAVAKLLNLVTTNQIRSDLRAFKAVAETGEKPTTEGQPAGRHVRGDRTDRAEKTTRS